MAIIDTRSGLSKLVEDEVKLVSDKYYVDLIAIIITDIEFSPAFESTVEDKMIAEQKKLKAEYDKATAIIQAEQALEVAKLEAQAKIAQAEANSKSELILAKADADAIKMKSIEIARMLGFKINETIITVDEKQVTKFDIDFTGKTAEEIKVISDYLKYIEYLNIWNGVLPEVMLGEQAASIILNPNGQ